MYMYYLAFDCFRTIGQLFMDILHFKEFGDTDYCHECILGVYLVMTMYVPFDALPLVKQRTSSGIYYHIQLNCNVLGIDNVMPL